MMPVREMSEMGEAALQYARMGWWVFPLHSPRPGGRCTCNRTECDRQGKHPRTRNGLLDASVDEDRISAWWEMWPDANIGISTGPSGLVAIDIDPRHGGDESYRELVQKHGSSLRDTVTALTGGGGEHYIFLCPDGEQVTNVTSSEKFTGPLGQGVDVRADGGYIVVAPSLHVSGAFYDWAIDAGPESRMPAPLPFSLFELLKAPTKPTKTKLASSADILAGVDEGNRDFTLFQFASRLRAADVPYDMALSLIYEAADNCRPPFNRKDAEKRVLSAYRRYQPHIGTYQEPTALPQHEGGLSGRTLLWSLIQKGVPEPEWVVPDVLVAGHVHLLYGEPGCGKTSLTQGWMRDLVEDGKPCLFIDEESGAGLIAARFAALGMGKKVDEYLHYFDFAGIGIADAEQLYAYCESIRPAIVAFDSFADVLNVSDLDENDSIDVTKWMMQVAVRIARGTNAAVAVLDHAGKDATSTKYSRGSGAKKAKADIAWFIEKRADFDTTHEGRVTLHRTKNRPGYMLPQVQFVMGGRGGEMVVERLDLSQHEISSLPLKAIEVLQYLRGSQPDRVGTGSIAPGVSLKEDQTRMYLKQLAELGMVKTEGEGRSAGWIIQPAGLDFLDSDNPRLGDSKPRLGGGNPRVDSPSGAPSLPERERGQSGIRQGSSAVSEKRNGKGDNTWWT